jgi:hypothetical protein
MALGDILEALAQGASGGYETYSRLSQAERERQEREKDRQEQRAYQQEVLALQQRAADRADAEAERQRVGDIEKGLYEGSLREVQDVLNPAAIRQTASDARSAVARSLDEDLFEGASKAPAQTYAAQRIAGEAMRPSMSFMDEVPEFTPSETFREQGSQEYSGSAVRPVTPEERRASEREEQERQRLLAIEEEARQYALLQERADAAVAEARGRGITDPYTLADIETQILTGTRVSRPPEPRATTAVKTPVERVIAEITDFSGRPQGLTGRPPNAEEVQNRLLFLSALYGLSPDESGELAERVTRASQPIRPPLLP